MLRRRTGRDSPRPAPARRCETRGDPAIATSGGPDDPRRPADLVLTGGRVATMDAARRWASALAVRDGRIVAVGSDTAVRLAIGPRDAGHRAARPDGHAGLPGRPRPPGPRRARRCSAATSTRTTRPAATTRRSSRPTRGAPGRAWIRGGGWYMAAFEGGTPRREDLDRIVPDRPAFLTNRDGHGAWVNTQGARAGRHHRGDRRPGRRPDRARPRRHAERHAPRGRDGPRRRGCCPTTRRRTSRRRCGSASATCTSSASPPGRTPSSSRDAEERAYVALASTRRADRPRRRRAVVGAPPRRRADRGVRRATARRPRSAATPPTSVKLMMDGVLENFTGADARAVPRRRTARPTEQPRPAPDRPRGPEDAGSRARRARVPAALPRDRRPGGARPRSTRSRPRARANGPSDTRPHIAHIQVIHPDDIPRFRQLDVAANAQPLWAAHEDQMDVLTIPFLGEPLAWQYPFRSLRPAGAVLAMGSDWSVSSANPLLEMEIAVERQSTASPRVTAASSCPRSGSTSSTRSRRSRPARRT